MISGGSAHIHIHGTNISHNNGSEGGGLYVFTVSCYSAVHYNIIYCAKHQLLLLLLGWS
jgi:hypothetical protein